MVAKIARGLGVSRSAVHQWERVPAERVVEIERISGIPREKLRPDLHLPRTYHHEKPAIECEAA